MNSSQGIAIPTFTTPVKASGGSGEGGRGMRGENLDVSDKAAKVIDNRAR